MIRWLLASLFLSLFWSGKADVTVSPISQEIANKVPGQYWNEAVNLYCAISGLTEAAEVVWTKDGSDVRNLAEGYDIDDGAGYFNGEEGIQVTTLYIPETELEKGENTIFTCVVAVPGTERTVQATPELRFYTISTMHAKLTLHVAQTLTCKITGVTEPAEVTWIDMDWNEITDDERGYTISQGSVNDDQVQEATLTIFPDTLRNATDYHGNYVYYHCAVKSRKYPESPQSLFRRIEAQLLRFGMYTTESEVEINTSTNVSCMVYGLSKQLDSVKWEKPDSEGVITDGTDGYKIDVGTYEDDGDGGRQESVLTIPASEVKADSNFTCVVQSREHGIDEEKEDANLFVFTITPYNKKATKNIDVTLTCKINNIRDEPAYVEWVDPEGNVIANDTEGYDMQGSITMHAQNGSFGWLPGFQETFLTISALKLQEVRKQAVNSVVEYKCSAWSSRTDNSPASDRKHKIAVTFLILQVEGEDVEVFTNTSAQLSCVVTGLTRQLDSVKWEKLNSGGVITDGTDGYKIDVGTYNDDTNSQTTVLTVPAPLMVPEHLSNYSCVIQSDEHGHTATSPVKEQVKVALKSQGEKNYLHNIICLMCLLLLGTWNF